MLIKVFNNIHRYLLWTFAAVIITTTYQTMLIKIQKKFPTKTSLIISIRTAAVLLAFTINHSLHKAKQFHSEQSKTDIKTDFMYIFQKLSKKLQLVNYFVLVVTKPSPFFSATKEKKTFFYR